MVRHLHIALLAAVVLVAPLRAEPPTVILLSWDGVGPADVARPDLPNVARLMRDGAVADGVVPPFPSTTFPAHVTLATGAPVERHGIVGNVFRDRERGWFRYLNDASWLRAEPLWAAAERQGVRAAVFFWVGSETDWQGVGATHRMAPFDAGVGEADKVRQLLAWLDLPPAERPRLLMSWWRGTDREGHRNGPDSAAVRAAMREQDRHLGTLLDGLDARGAWPHTTLIVVSDHAMVAATETVDLGPVFEQHGIAAEIVHGGGAANVWLDDLATRDVALAAIRALPGVDAWPAGELPAHWRADVPDRFGDIVAVTRPPRALLALDRTERAALALRRLAGGAIGAHGYDPSGVEMRGIFLALGRGVVAKSRLRTLHAVDVAPTVAALLGIAPPRDATGRPVAGIEAPPPSPLAELRPSRAWNHVAAAFDRASRPE